MSTIVYDTVAISLRRNELWAEETNLKEYEDGSRAGAKDSGATDTPPTIYFTPSQKRPDDSDSIIFELSLPTILGHCNNVNTATDPNAITTIFPI